ncbi:MAG: sigma-54 dependent transcriptional regulator [Spirochaetaceae bacterium]|jgi:two-component system nitrogen regulation response regulator NtrX|nr:sigma-54 dependent transcriptional regulator [Spirochaetaceae bacterium]
MTKILIIDDEPGIRRTLASIMEDEHYTVFTAEDAVLGLEILESEQVNMVFLDVMLPKMGGMEALERIRAGWPELEVVVISGHANVDMAVRAVKLGAFDFLEKPLSLDKVLTLCRNVLTLEKLREENRDLKKNLNKDEIIGLSPQIAEVKSRIKQAAQSDARILIYGENGTGKELAARAIHYGSARAGKAFVEVNCAAIPDTLIESELFGHEKGAFTDAVSSRKGRFELAHGGTLFLDEIGDMSLAAQAKMLRAIQEQQIQRVGGEKTITTDVRVIAATNKNLETECKAGRFRQDLFFRLNVIPVVIPSLRERREDIPLLLFHFLKELSGVNYELTDEAREALLAYPWPGNIRELKNLAERIAVMWDDEHISLKAIRDLLRWTPAEETPALPETGSFLSGSQDPFPSNIFHLKYNEAKEMFEKYYLEFQLTQNNGVISRAAEAIGIYPSNLHVKLRKYNIVRTER